MVPAASRRNRLPRGRASIEHRAVEVRVAERARRLGEIDGAVVRHMHAQRPAFGCGDHRGGPVGCDPQDPAVVDTGPDGAVAIDDDILGRIAGQPDDGQLCRRQLRQRVDRRRLPANGIDRWLALRSCRRGYALTRWGRGGGDGRRTPGTVARFVASFSHWYSVTGPAHGAWFMGCSFNT